MKNRIMLPIWVLIACMIPGCASYSPRHTGKSTVLDAVSPVDLTDAQGKRQTYVFMGETWVQRIDGKNNLSGTLKFADDQVTLTPTHRYIDEKNPLTKRTVGWKKITGPDLLFEYHPDQTPPLSLKK
ncbi:MAG: hypothetical protein LBD55_04150 [Treponema sp.]|jgi:hypothetical protein|nr:hypothetical protein [Treponema sp.]